MDVLYLLTLGFLAAHELDAVACHEWRLLFVLRRMDDHRARAWFVGLHVPLFAALAWSATGAVGAAQVRLGVAAFAIVHLGLHYRLRRNPLYEFHSPLSRTLIIAAAVSGAAYGWVILT